MEPIMIEGFSDSERWRVEHLAKSYQRAREGSAKKEASKNLDDAKWMFTLIALIEIALTGFFALLAYGSLLNSTDDSLVLYIFLFLLILCSEGLIMSFPIAEIISSRKILKDQTGCAQTKAELELLEDPVARLNWCLVNVEPEILGFVKEWNNYARRRDLGLLKEHPDLERIGPVAKQAYETYRHTFVLAKELTAMRVEQQARVASSAQLTTGVDIAETLETLRAAAAQATAYVQAYQEVEGSSLSCPLEAIAQIEKVQAELRRDLPQSRKLELARKAAQRAPA